MIMLVSNLFLLLQEKHELITSEGYKDLESEDKIFLNYSTRGRPGPNNKQNMLAVA